MYTLRVITYANTMETTKDLSWNAAVKGADDRNRKGDVKHVEIEGPEGVYVPGQWVLVRK